jgi:hypothetical protein
MNKFFLLLPLVMLAGCVYKQDVPRTMEEARARAYYQCYRSESFTTTITCHDIFEKEEKTK